jgi:SAM-dependent methyltransferase
MGLAERRAVERFRNVEWPRWKERIDQAAGFDVPVEVAWGQLAAGDDASGYPSFLPRAYFEALIGALALVAADDLGKSALKAGLTKVVIKNEGDYLSRAGLAFADGVLTLDHQPQASTSEVEEQARGIEKLLKSGLWDASYTGQVPPPWDIGRPQPALAALADAGVLAGRVLDAGCGTGEHTLLAAAHGARATGVDAAPAAIGQARAEAAARGLRARFEVGDVLDLGAVLGPGALDGGFDVVIDSGLFHVLSDAERPRYVASLAAALRGGGRCYLMCFSDSEPGGLGPRRVSEGELRAAFADGWQVLSVVPATFEINPVAWAGEGTIARAWLATVSRGG